jgi:hypothetical protein
MFSSNSSFVNFFPQVSSSTSSCTTMTTSRVEVGGIQSVHLLGIWDTNLLQTINSNILF